MQEQAKYRLWKQRAIHIGVLFLCAALLYGGAAAFLKDRTRYPKLEAVWYEVQEESYDLIAVGSSHMNGGYDPQPMYEEYGIRGVNMATAGQPFEVSYYLLKECLKRHSPKVVLLDVYYMCSLTPYGEEGHTRSVLDYMRPSKNKREALQECVPPEERRSYQWPFLKYHSRWDQLSAKDFQAPEPFDDFGFFAGAAKYGQPMEFQDWSGVEGEIPEKQERFLYRFFELAQDEGFKLVMVNFPSDYTATAADPDWNAEPEKLFNKVQRLAEENRVDFLDLCDPETMEQMALDFGNDMTNPGHLNHYGAAKATQYINQWIKENIPGLIQA